MRLSHDEYYLAMLRLVAARSTCVRRAVGAIITDSNHRVLSTGFNGVPIGFPHCTDVPCPGAEDKSGDNSRCLAVHAEVNAVLQCPVLDRAAILYVSCAPCFSCAKMLCNTKIKRVVCLEPYPGIGRDLLIQAGIELVIMPENSSCI